MKISKIFFIIFIFIALFPFYSKAGGPVGYVHTLDPIIKNNLIESLRKTKYLIGDTDYEIEMAILRYLSAHRSLLRTDVPYISKNKAVDTTICLMMYTKHLRIDPDFDYNRCNEFIEPK